MREHRAGFGCAPASPVLFSWQLFPLEHSQKSKTPCILSSYPGFEMNCVSPVSKLFSQSRSLSLSFPTERNQCFLEIWLIPGFGQCRHKKNLDYSFEPKKKKKKEMLKMIGSWNRDRITRISLKVCPVVKSGMVIVQWGIGATPRAGDEINITKVRQIFTMCLQMLYSLRKTQNTSIKFWLRIHYLDPFY